MKIKSTICFAITLVSLFGFLSCSGDDDSVDDVDNNDSCTQFMQEYENVTEALQAYSENPTLDNCENYKDAMLAFFEEYKDCTYWGPQYDDAIDELENIDCSNDEA